MSELDGERGWTDDDAAWSNPVERNLERLKNSAVAGTVLGVLLGFIAVAVQQNGSAGTGEVSWGAVITFVVALGSVAWGALAALAYWSCAALLAGRTPQD
jgi:uncharacterized membrane protein YccC